MSHCSSQKTVSAEKCRRSGWEKEGTRVVLCTKHSSYASGTLGVAAIFRLIEKPQSKNNKKVLLRIINVRPTGQIWAFAFFFFRVDVWAEKIDWVTFENGEKYKKQMRSVLDVDRSLFHSNNWMEHISKAYILHTYTCYFLKCFLVAKAKVP